MYDVLLKLGSIERSVTYLEGHSDDVKKKLEELSKEVISAKATFQTLKWIGGAIGAICIACLGIIATVVTMIAKHFLHW